MEKETKDAREIALLLAVGNTFKATSETLSNKLYTNVKNRARSLAEIVKRKMETDGIKIRVVRKRVHHQTAQASAIAKFRENYPKESKILDEMLKNEKTKTASYLVVQIEETIPHEYFIKVLEELGFSPEQASAIYPHLFEIGDRLKRFPLYEEHSIFLKD